MIRLYFAIILSIALTSCAPAPEETTKAKIALGAALGQLADGFNGHLYFVAHHVESGRFLNQNLSSVSSSMELPNGTWNMMVYGWEGGTEPFEGTMKCNGKKDIQLNGVEVD